MTLWNGTLFCDECASLLLNACILVSVLVQRIWWTLESAIHRKSSRCHTSCNVTDYQLWRGPSSEIQGQLVGAGKKFEEKIRAKKSQGLLTFPRPNFFFRPFRLLKIRAKKSQELLTFVLPSFFLARSDFSLPPLPLRLRGCGRARCNPVQSAGWSMDLARFPWPGRNELRKTSHEQYIITSITVNFFSHFSLCFSFQSWNWKSHH